MQRATATRGAAAAASVRTMNVTVPEPGAGAAHDPASDDLDDDDVWVSPTLHALCVCELSCTW